MYVFASRPSFTRLCAGIRKRMSLMSFSFLLPAVPCTSCLNCLLDWRQVGVLQLFCQVLLPGFVEDSMQHSCEVPLYTFTMLFVSNHVVLPYSSMDAGTTGKKSCFILSDRSYIHIIDNLSITFDTFATHMLTTL